MKKVTLLIILTSSILLGACKKKFSEINTNPNTPTQVEPSLLLRQVIYNFGDEMAYEGFVAGNLLGQYFTEVDFNLFDRHNLSSPQYGGNPWPFIYKNLRDNELILDKVKEKDSYQVYEGPALILKAYMTACVTDIYGDVPYSESLLGAKGNVNPKFDSQESIYTGENGILANLDKAISSIENLNTAIPLQGDVLFNGNMSSWLRFAKSLKIKYLMRISDRVNVNADLQALYDENNFISAANQNAFFSFTAGLPNSFRMAALKQGDFNLFVLSETNEEILSNLNDSRMQVFFRGTGNDALVYNGLLNGQDAASTSISVADYSFSGRIFREETNKMKANFMTSWETKFLLAEAAEKGFITANAQQLYEDAVQESFVYWGAQIPSNYLTSGPAVYGTNPINQILTQKWISSICNGYEGWIEYRRTGFPALKTLAASLNNNLIPVRMPYPGTEEALNGVNFGIASSGTNGNSINSKVWWDIN
jgi:hypothetical protein